MFAESIGKFFEAHPPLCKSGGALFIEHVKTCADCQKQMSEIIEALPKEFPFLRMILSADKVREIISNLQSLIK